jgi:hypothetical protein
MAILGPLPPVTNFPNKIFLFCMKRNKILTPLPPSCVTKKYERTLNAAKIFLKNLKNRELSSKNSSI